MSDAHPSALSESAPVELIPADAPFSDSQRAWLNGFFAAVLSRVSAAAAAAGAEPAVPSVVISILYASQTGTAEGLARKTAKALKARGYGATTEDLGQVGLAGLVGRPWCLFIASTYGEGDPPDSVQAFSAELAEAGGAPLAGMRYSVLALGDRNYAKFCQFGGLLDHRLAELGAERLAARMDADADPAPAFDAWRETLWTGLPAVSGAALASPAAEAEDEPAWSRDRPFAARLLGTARLTGAESDKDTRHVRIGLLDSGLTYEPGDALGVWPRNGRELVERLLTATDLAGDTTVVVAGQTIGLREALTAHCELGRVTTAMAIKFAERFQDRELQSLVEPDAVEALQRYQEGRDAADLFGRPAARGLSAQVLIELLPRLAPRLYSISSSLAAHTGEVHLTIAVVRQTASGAERPGIASNHLGVSLADGAHLPVYVHHNARFRLPADPAVPVIMIGPGTGIAPFRAFLEERAARGLTGRTWLFFGDRRSHCDFLYREELEAWLAAGTLTHLDTAFSRDTAEKVYVQDRMRAQAKGLWSWIADGAHIYVCGDASRMAKDVDRALVEIFMSEGGLSEASAQLELRHIGANGRYLRDVY